MGRARLAHLLLKAGVELADGRRRQRPDDRGWARAMEPASLAVLW
jgi:hypothetical protein